MGNSDTAIIIGIDFGTTYSGVSWALTAGRKEVRIINDWPNPHGSVGNHDKVPTTISYDANGKVARWGHNVLVKDDSFKWIKLMLDPSHKYFANSPKRKELTLQLKKVGKTAEEVVKDYLKCLWDYTIEHLKRKKGPNFQRVYTVKVVLTVPAVWSALAKDRTLRAAKLAGIPAESKLVTEPEAAALALLKDKCEEQSIKVGDGLVVCDAGGGTVDLISYKVEALKPFKVRECVMGDGDLCGSAFLDMAFEEFIREIVGPSQYDDEKKIRPRDKNAMMRDFEDGLKRSFTKNYESIMTVDLKGVDDDSGKGIDDECITIEPERLRNIFDSICLKIQQLIEKQLVGIESKGIPRKSIGIVGGFGESKYLHEYLTAVYTGSRAMILQEPGGISAVCRGATLWGLEQNDATSILSRVARCSYGIVYMYPWDELNPNHQPSDKWWDPAKRRWMALGQMAWLLKRGEDVREGHVLEGRSFYSVNIEGSKTGNWTTTEQLYYQTDADTPPARRDNPRVKQLCLLSFEIPYSTIYEEQAYMSEGKEWVDVHFSRDILCGGAALDFRVMYKEQLLQSVEANYVED
ncbi:hypothetical protein EV426DRAFT_610121 [Tirmania nivea]|nr:hypothetical protein EV426DRAFT_610121 [Tirmania nivea]